MVNVRGRVLRTLILQQWFFVESQLVEYMGAKTIEILGLELC